MNVSGKPRDGFLSPSPKSILAVVLSALVVVVSCDRADTARSASAAKEDNLRSVADAADASDLSPIEVVRRVHEYRLAGRLGLVAQHVLPDQRPHVLQLIRAVDRLLQANQALQAAVTNHIGPASAEGFDRSQVANIIGVFSNEVEILDQRLDGEVAVVTVQVARRVPLDEVTLVRLEDRWLIQTDPPIPGVADELRRLAEVLLDAARMLDKQAMTPIELKKELDLREASIGRRITALTRKPPP